MNMFLLVVLVAVACLMTGLLTASFTLFLRLCLQGKGMLLNWYYLRLLALWEKTNNPFLKPIGLCFWCYGSWVAVIASCILFPLDLIALCGVLSSNYLFLGVLHRLEGLKP